MKCPNCGSTIKDGSIYCDFCGKSIQIVPDYNVLDEEVLASFIGEKKQQNTENKSQSLRTGSEEKDKKHKGSIHKMRLIICGSLIIAACMILLGTYCYMHSYAYEYHEATICDKNAEYKTAITHFLKAADYKTDDKKALTKAGTDYMRIKKYAQAEKILKQVILIDPEYAPAYRVLLQTYQKDEKFEAIASLEKTVNSEKILKLFSTYVTDVPIFSINAGTYDKSISLELSAPDEYDIVYTTDGSTPSKKNGTSYLDPIEIKDGKTTVKAVLINTKGSVGKVVTRKYKISYAAPADPVVSPDSGTYTVPTQITISAGEDTAIYYTWDNSAPTAASALYTGPMDMPAGNNVLSVIAISKNNMTSNIIKVNYRYLP